VIELIAFAPAPASLTVFGRGPRPTKVALRKQSILLHNGICSIAFFTLC